MGSASQFTARVESRSDVARIAMTGELDTATVPTLLGQLTPIEQNGFNAIMLDLREVSFVDSSGLRAFLEASQRAKTNGHRLILIGASPSLRRLFALTRMEFLLDEQDAASTLGRFTGKRRPGDRMEFAVADADG
jgi:anti-anti-sigma factor